MSTQKPLNPDNNDPEQAMQTDVLLIYPYFYTHAHKSTVTFLFFEAKLRGIHPKGLNTTSTFFRSVKSESDTLCPLKSSKEN
jgi:hypothetical protein